MTQGICIDCSKKYKGNPEFCPHCGIKLLDNAIGTGRSKDEKGNPFFSLIGWIIGIFFLAGSIGQLSVNFISAPFLFVIGLILVPPSSRAIQKKLNLKLNIGLKILIVIIGLFIIGATAPNTEPSKASKQSNTIKSHVKK